MDQFSLLPSGMRKRCFGRALFCFLAGGVFAVEAPLARWSSDPLLALSHFCYRLTSFLRQLKEGQRLGEDEERDMVLAAIQTLEVEHYRQTVNYMEEAANCIDAWLKKSVDDECHPPLEAPEDLSHLVKASKRLRAMLKAVNLIFFAKSIREEELGLGSFCRAPLVQPSFGRPKKPEEE